ncbi:MAG: hypothetical protein ACHQQQ_04185 [Bacteroidota bacterium]
MSVWQNGFFGKFHRFGAIILFDESTSAGHDIGSYVDSDWAFARVW